MPRRLRPAEHAIRHADFRIGLEHTASDAAYTPKIRDAVDLYGTAVGRWARIGLVITYSIIEEERLPIAAIQAEFGTAWQLSPTFVAQFARLWLPLATLQTKLGAARQLCPTFVAKFARLRWHAWWPHRRALRKGKIDLRFCDRGAHAPASRVVIGRARKRAVPGATSRRV